MDTFCFKFSGVLIGAQSCLTKYIFCLDVITLIIFTDINGLGIIILFLLQIISDSQSQQFLWSFSPLDTAEVEILPCYTSILAIFAKTW